MAKIRVGLIGYGYAGRTFHAPLIAACTDLDLIAVASSDPGKVRRDRGHVAVAADPFALTTADDVDLIVIASPNDSHFPLARAALEAGKHVVVDKPFTTSLAEARALATLAEARGALLSVFQNRRWDSDFRTVRAALAKDTVGTVVHFESHLDRFRPVVRDRWRENPGEGAGLWFDLGPHLVDQTLQLFGLPDGIQADFAAQRDGALTNDWAHVILRYGSMRAVLHASVLVAGGRRRFVVHGTRGTLVKHNGDGQEAQLVSGMRPGAPAWGIDSDPLMLYGEDGSERLITATTGDQRCFYDAVAASIAMGRPNPVPPAQAVAVMAVVEAAIGSAASGLIVTPDFTPTERTHWSTA